MIAAKRKIFSSFQHTLSTKCSRRSTIKHQRNCCSDAVMKEGAKNATPHALHQSSSTKFRSQLEAKSGLAKKDCLCAKQFLR